MQGREWLESPRLIAVARCVGYRLALSPDDLPDLLQEVRLAIWNAGMDQPINSTWVFHTTRHHVLARGNRRRPPALD